MQWLWHSWSNLTPLVHFVSRNQTITLKMENWILENKIQHTYFGLLPPYPLSIKYLSFYLKYLSKFHTELFNKSNLWEATHHGQSPTYWSLLYLITTLSSLAMIGKFGCPIIYTDTLKSIHTNHNITWNNKTYWTKIFLHRGQHHFLVLNILIENLVLSPMKKDLTKEVTKTFQWGKQCTSYF